MKTALHQSQLVDDQRMEKPSQVGARRHENTGKGLLDGAGPSHALPAFEHQDALAGACEIGSADKAVMTRTDYDGIPRPRSKFSNRLRQANLA
jgi:hypothetical protein